MDTFGKNNAETFESYRRLMFTLAYRMIGSAMEAEDIVQEAYLRVHNAQNIQNPKAYYCKVVTNLALDYLKSAQVQREQYFGMWLPEPLHTHADEDHETLSSAFVLLLQQLSPLERAVFLLHEVFDYEYGEIAALLNKEEPACRQLLHRAKSHVAQHKPRFSTTAQAHEAMLMRFLHALASGDIEALIQLLAEDIQTVSDGGGKVSAATRVVVGRERVVRFLLGLRKQWSPEFRAEIHTLNTRKNVVFYQGQRPFTVFLIQCDQQHIGEIYYVLNPDKLTEF